MIHGRRIEISWNYSGNNEHCDSNYCGRTSLHVYTYSVSSTCTSQIILNYYMTWVCSQSNVCSDWLIPGHYSPVMPTGRLQACKSQAKTHIINNLLTLNVRSLWEISNLGLAILTSLYIARSIRQGLGPRLSRKDLTLG